MADDDIDELPDGTPEGEVQSKDAKPWLNLIAQAEKKFESYHERCDNIDKLYANLEALAALNRDRQMQLFWANLQTLQPSIYARPPQPVVMPRFKDRRPIQRTASEFLERSVTVSFETSHLDRTLKMVRDDLARLSRGVLWPRYETGEARGGGFTKRICYEFKFRRDFIHDPARSWDEVDWVDGVSYLSRKEMRKRFAKISGKAYQAATYEVRKDSDDEKSDTRRKARVHEIWCRSENKVIWVADGCETLLEEAKPHLELDDFFPCPEPAYGTKQPGSLIPVPDVMQYRDQLEEINQLTNRIHALADAVKVRGFYPAGAGEIGDAIEAAVKSTTDNQVLVPISNWAMLGQGKPTDMIVWLPIDQIVAAIVQLVELRRQLIQDVYEISGISDILRGQTDPNETLGAQELKAQTGSTRVRDKQEEVVRLSRDTTRIAAEIMAENFDQKTLLDMSQMEMPTDADIKRQVGELEAQGARLKEAVDAVMQSPDAQAMAQQNPQEAQQAQQMAEQKAQQLQGQIGQLKATVTVDQVMKLLRDQRLRPFIFDIETDSTIVPDENAQKQRATEYATSMTGLLRELVPAVQNAPQIAPLASEMLNYVNGVFRVGRQFEQVVEEFTDQMKQAAAQPKGPSPEEIKAQADAQAQQMAAQADQQRAQAEGQKAATEAQAAELDNAERAQKLKLTEAQEADKLAEAALQRQIKAQEADDASNKRNAEIADAAALALLQRTMQQEKHAQEMEKGGLEIRLLNTKIEQATVATENSLKTTEAGISATEAKAKAAAEKPAQEAR